MVRIAGVGEAFPGAYHDQADLVRALTALWSDGSLEPATIERIHRNTTVEGRHIALPLREYAPGVPWGEINRKWIRIADEIGTTAVRNSLQAAGMSGADVGALVFVTVTGIATPSIDARIANRLHMPASVRRMPLFGLGCVAGASGLARCADLVESRPESAAVLLSVELCSLTVQLDDFSMANVVATGLFGDGAAAVTLTGPGRPAAGSRDEIRGSEQRVGQ
jgi:alkylresorcinol/alkylpyrone synthase